MDTSFSFFILHSLTPPQHTTAPAVSCRPNHVLQCFKDKKKLERVLADPRVYKGKLRLQSGLEMMALSKVRVFLAWGPSCACVCPSRVAYSDASSPPHPAAVRASFHGVHQLAVHCAARSGGPSHSTWAQQDPARYRTQHRQGAVVPFLPTSLVSAITVLP